MDIRQPTSKHSVMGKGKIIKKKKKKAHTFSFIFVSLSCSRLLEHRTTLILSWEQRGYQSFPLHTFKMNFQDIKVSSYYLMLLYKTHVCKSYLNTAASCVNHTSGFGCKRKGQKHVLTSPMYSIDHTLMTLPESLSEKEEWRKVFLCLALPNILTSWLKKCCIINRLIISKVKKGWKIAGRFLETLVQDV